MRAFYDSANKHILLNYVKLREECRKYAWITNVFPIERRCRSFIANSTSTSAAEPDMSTTKRNLQTGSSIWKSLHLHIPDILNQVTEKEKPTKSDDIEGYCWSAESQ